MKFGFTDDEKSLQLIADPLEHFELRSFGDLDLDSRFEAISDRSVLPGRFQLPGQHCAEAEEKIDTLLHLTEAVKLMRFG